MCTINDDELMLALAEAKADYEAGRYVIETADDHVKRIANK